MRKAFLYRHSSRVKTTAVGLLIEPFPFSMVHPRVTMKSLFASFTPSQGSSSLTMHASINEFMISVITGKPRHIELRLERAFLSSFPGVKW